jgi:hypothetical protein
MKNRNVLRSGLQEDEADDGKRIALDRELFTNYVWPTRGAQVFR